jgi:hypothetical protein
VREIEGETMRESKAVQALGGVLWIYAAYVGASWCWSGLSIIVGNISGSCEVIPLYAFGTGIGPELGDCLAKADESSWGVNGMLVGVGAMLVGAAILTALLLVPSALARRRSLHAV